MDLFVFPSETDSFGNVILEALASGVPVITTNRGGPQYTLRRSNAGLVAGSLEDFVRDVAGLMANRAQLAAMSRAARAHALAYSWDAIFDSMYAGYRRLLARPLAAAAIPEPASFAAAAGKR
jgi:glycosyltransferase involved in cell wall biosynthesis